jgi:acetyl esterase/lipase
LIRYPTHDGREIPAFLSRPHGAGPFPVMVELHGGVWTENDRTRGRVHHEAFASNGIAVASLDFRQGPAGYPHSLADINYAIRWVKANAGKLKTRPELVGITGTSSGGHLAMLAAMRPNDPKFSSIALPPGSPSVDASVRCVVMFWPVIDPLGRHHNAKRLNEGPNPPPWPPRTMKLSMAYWQNEETMAEGSPLLAIKRGDKVALPPAIWIQSRGDLIHDYRDPNSGFDGSEAQRFAAMYRKAGGSIELEYYDAPLHFTNDHPELPESQRALRRAVEFTKQQIAVP